MEKLKPRFNRDDVEVISREHCHQGFLRIDKLVLTHALCAGGRSESLQRELLIKPEAVGVLLYDPNLDKIVMVRQFRAGALEDADSPWMLELIAGLVDKDESLEDVAIRESIEESDCIPTEIIRICDYYNSPGASNEKVTLFCGRVDASTAGGIHGLAEEHEDIEVVVLPLEEAVGAVNQGIINNAMSIIAIQWLEINRNKLMQRWISS